MQIKKSIILLMSALLLSLGIFGAGFSVSKGIYYVKQLNRSLTVKGIAERDVKSDLGIWEINYREIGSNLITLNTAVMHDQSLVSTFLKAHGFSEQDIEIQPVKVDDRLANNYSQNNATPNTNERYVVTGALRVRSSRVDLIQEVNRMTNTLLQQGVSLALDASSIAPNPSYYFTQLDTIRPAMFAEATRSARMVAQQFAENAKTRLGDIQHASQGVFQVMSRDASLGGNTDGSEGLGAINKKVRLVTTIEFRLK